MATPTKVKTKLTDYSFPEKVIARIDPIATLIERGMLDQARGAIGELALEICKALPSGAIPPKEADQTFTLLLIFLEDNYPDVNLGEKAEELILEGQYLHHYADEHSSDIEWMENVAKQLVHGQ